MGWYIRKSFRIAPGLRLNLSRSGLGLSAGVRGLRVSAGPRGAYVSAGAGGLYYRRRIGGSGRRSAAAGGAGQSVAELAPTVTLSPGVDVSQLVDADAAALLAALNACASARALLPAVLLVGVAASFAVGALIHPLVCLLCLALVAAVAHPVHLADVDRRIFEVTYHLDAEWSACWERMAGALRTLGGSERLWRVEDVDARPGPGDDARARAPFCFTRSLASLTRGVPPVIRSSVPPFVLDVGVQRLIFLPDRIYVWQSGLFGAVGYGEVRLSVQTIDRLEFDAAPAEARIVGKTWQHVRKDGAPDRRYGVNPEVPICRYGAVALAAPEGLLVGLCSSSVDRARQFGREAAAAMPCLAREEAEDRTPLPPRRRSG